jgi:hypothetical protein
VLSTIALVTLMYRVRMAKVKARFRSL